MKNVAVLTAVALVGFGMAGNAFGYDGASKMVVSMARPEPIKIASGSAPVLSYDLWRGSKPVLQLLQRVPKPTLTAERIREELPGPSTGTKAVVLFQRGR